MKKIILLATLLTVSLLNSQEFKHETKSITGVFSAEGKTKNELYSSINKWISLNYNSANNVIQLNDKEGGNIIIKGVNKSVYKNVMKELYPKNKYMSEYNTIKFNHTIEINIKEGKYRVIYTLTDMVEDYNVADYIVELEGLTWNLISLNGMNDIDIINYNNYVDALWKKSLVGKKKRQKFLNTTEPVFSELNKGVVIDLKATMISINNIVNSNKDDW